MMSRKIPGPSNSTPGGAAERGDASDEPFGPGSPPIQVLRDFRLVSKLGEGGMGVVYKAHQLSMDRDVALKILPPRLAENQEFVERFYREARTSAKLDHPNIVRGVAVGEEQGLHYFAMEFVDGDNLERWLHRLGRLSVGDAVKITRDVARALDHAHSRRILHRDIKPANIIITPDGQVKLADLGLAKAAADDSGLTQVGEMAGTPAYMAPEQARNTATADARSDIYALGATLYHLLTGKKPFSGKTMIEVVEAKEDSQYEAARLCNPEVPENLDAIIKRMMASDPKRRFQDAAEVIEALDATGLASAHLSLDSNLTATATVAPAWPATSRRRARSSRRWLKFAMLTMGAATAALGVFLVVQLFSHQQSHLTAPSAESAAALGSSRARESTRDVEPVDVILARAVEQVTSAQIDAARRTLSRGLEEHPGEDGIERPLRELESGVLLLFQYQTPEETSPVVPTWVADSVTLSRRDNYRFAIIPGRQCFVYAFQRDPRPRVTSIFPSTRYSPQSNPLEAGHLYWLPYDPHRDGTSWMHLDASVGDEQVYFVALTQPLRNPEGVGQELVSGPEQLRRAFAQDPNSFLQAGAPPAEPCFARTGNVLEVFQFSHK